MKCATLLVVALLPLSPLVAGEQTNSLETCRAENQALREEVSRLKADADRLNVAILVLSKQLAGSPSAPPQAEATPAPSGPARLKVTITTKYSGGQACRIAADGKEVSRIDYPSLTGADRVTEYDSDFIELVPGDHRIEISCTAKSGSKVSSISTNQSFRAATTYRFQAKINMWSKVLEQVSFDAGN